MATQPVPDVPTPVDDPVPTPVDPIPPVPTDPVTEGAGGNPLIEGP